MSANTHKSMIARWRRLAPVRRFVRHQEGGTAVEFALVLLPFLLLMFIIIETSLVFFAGQTLETAAADSARLIKTGQAQTQGLNAETFKNAVCARIYALFDCASGMYVDVKTYATFGNIDNAITYDPTTGKPVTSYAPGAAGDIVVVRLIYQWPITTPLVQNYLANAAGNTRLLVATAAFRNEPYN